MSSRLTDTIRRQIIEKAVKQATAAQRAELHDRETALVKQAYEEIVPAKLRKALEDIPPGWVHMNDVIRVNANGWNVKLKNPNELAVTIGHNNRGETLGSPSPETADKIQKLAQDSSSLTELENEMRSKLRSVLNTVFTFKQLRERWPDGKEIYEEFDYATTKVPAVQFTEISAMLGLGKEEE